MQITHQNIQPATLSIVKLTNTKQLADARLGTDAAPFKIARPDASVRMVRDNYNNVHDGCSLYVELTLVMSPEDINTVLRMSAAVDMGYSVLLSLPLMESDFQMSMSKLIHVVTIGDKAVYTLSMYEKPVVRSHWGNISRWWNEFTFSTKKKLPKLRTEPSARSMAVSANQF